MSWVISQIEDQKLASEIGLKFDTTLLIKVFRALEPNSLSSDPSTTSKARDNVIETLNDSAFALRPTLLLSALPTVDVIVDAIAAKRRISRIFSNSEELERTIDALTNETGFPGWLTLEKCERFLNQAKKETGSLLTMELVFGYQIMKADGTVTLHSHMKEVSAKLRMGHQESKSDIASRCLTTRIILERVEKYPNKYSVSPELGKYRLRLSGGNSLCFAPKQNKTDKGSKSARIVMLPGPLQVVRCPDNRLYALGRSNSVALIAMGPEEQAYVESRYRGELNRYARDMGHDIERDRVRRRESEEAEEGVDIHSLRRLDGM